MSALGSLSKSVSKINTFSYFEIKELGNLLLPGEMVEGVLSGFYSLGSATLCVTNQRLLLIDKKLLRLNIEDIRYKSMSEIQYSQQIFMASIKIIYAGQSLIFRSPYNAQLRNLTRMIQLKTLEAPIDEQPKQLTATSSRLINSRYLGRPIGARNSSITMYEHLQKWRKVTDYISGMHIAGNML